MLPVSGGSVTELSVTGCHVGTVIPDELRFCTTKVERQKTCGDGGALTFPRLDVGPAFRLLIP
jgi:hypothetical protein